MADKKTYSEAGMSMLETAGVVLIALTLIYMAAGVVSYYQIQSTLTSVVEREVFDNALRPVTFRAGTLVFDEGKMQEDVQSMLARATANIEEQLKIAPGTDSQYLIEIQVARLAINPQNGSVEATNFPPALKGQAGTLSIPSEIESKTRLQRVIQNAVDERGAGSIFAIPSGAFGQLDAQAYLPFGAVVALRFIYSFDKTITASVTKMLGISQYPIAYDVSVVGVRGSVSK